MKNKSQTYLKAACLAGTLVLASVILWELFLHQQGFTLSYNDDESLWANARSKVYDTTAPVIVGTSRAKYDIDLATWKRATGRMPVQLAIVGTNPRPVLSDLARDPEFRGTLLVDVMEPLFFLPDGSFMESNAKKRLSYYPHWSLSQQVSFHINRRLENHLLFLDEEQFSLNAMIKRLPISSRPGVFVFPVFPLNFQHVQPNGQSAFTKAFLKDTAMQHDIQGIWTRLGMTGAKKEMGRDTLDRIVGSVVADVRRIEARGGNVIFVRFPSSDPVWAAEQRAYPRTLYWDRLLKETGAPGIHFADYPELSRYTCPEWSHLTPADARRFTQELARIIQAETGRPLSRAISQNIP